MNQIDITKMLSNLSASLIPVQSLIAGLSYLFGLMLFYNAFLKFKEMAETPHSRTPFIIPLANLLAGAALVYLPSSLQSLSDTLFGSSGALQYSTYKPYDIYGVMRVFIQTAGLIWFFRGCILIVHSSEPGHQEGKKGSGPKGFAFVIAGIFAMNFEGTVGWLNYIMDSLLTFDWGHLTQF